MLLLPRSRQRRRLPRRRGGLAACCELCSLFCQLYSSSAFQYKLFKIHQNILCGFFPPRQVAVAAGRLALATMTQRHLRMASVAMRLHHAHIQFSSNNNRLLWLSAPQAWRRSPRHERIPTPLAELGCGRKDLSARSTDPSAVEQEANGGTAHRGG